MNQLSFRLSVPFRYRVTLSPRVTARFGPGFWRDVFVIPQPPARLIHRWMVGLPAAAAGGAAKPTANRPKAMHTTKAKVFRSRITGNPILCGGRTRVFRNKGIGAKINNRVQKGTLNPNWGEGKAGSVSILGPECSDLAFSAAPRRTVLTPAGSPFGVRCAGFEPAL